MTENLGNILGLAVGGAVALKILDVAFDKSKKKKSKKKLKKVI